MKRDELIKVLKTVMPGVSKGDALLQGADAFVFTPGLVQTYNDHLSVSHPANIDVTASVKAVEMVRVLEKMAGLDVQMKVEDNQLMVTDGNTNLAMKLMEVQTPSLIEALDLEGLEWNPIPKDFLPAIDLCLSSVSNNPAHGVLNGIKVDGTDLLASDNYRVAWSVIGEPMREFIIPGLATAALLKIPDLESYAVSTWVHFMNKEGAVFSSRLLGGDFPSDTMKGLFPANEDSVEYELPEALKPALERAAIMTSSQDGVMEYVTLSRKGDNLLVQGERQFGSVLDKVPAGEAGFPVDTQININPKFLLDIMGMTRKFRMSGSLLIFGGEGFLYLSSTISPKGE